MKCHLKAYRFQFSEIENSMYNAEDGDYNSINESTSIVKGNYYFYLVIL